MKECLSFKVSFRKGIESLLDNYQYGILSRDKILQERFRQKILDSFSEKTEGDFCLLENGILQGVARVKLLNWDTDLFGFLCTSVNFIASRGKTFIDERQNYHVLLNKIISWLTEKEVRLTTIKCDSREASLVSALHDHGFKYIETRVVLRHDLSSIPRFDMRADKFLRSACKEDIIPLQKISQSSRWDRFHTDQNFNRDIVDKYRAEWIKNLCLGFSDEVLVLEIKDNLAGFIAIKLHDGNRYGVIKLIAVDPEQRGQGIGPFLVNEALKWFKERTSLVFVSTQASNNESINMYLKNGFRWAPSGITMHRWS